MLERIRESSRSGLTMVVFAVIIVVFAFSFGAPMDGCQQASGPQRAATVAGHDVMTDQVNIIYNRYGGSDRDQDEDVLAEQQSKALKALVIINLLAAEAEKLGMRAGDEEVRDYILSQMRNAEFQAIYGRRGTIDRGLYKRYIQNQLRVSEATYEEYKSRELLAKKYLELATMQIGTLPSEIEQLDALRNNKVQLEYIKIAPALIKASITPTDAEVAEFVKNNQDKIKEVYDKDKEKKYSEPAQINFSRIYVKKQADEGTNPEELWATVKKRVLESKEDFNEVAGELSQDFSKAKKGKMGWTAVDNMTKEVLAALEGAKEGDVKEIELDYAYLLVKFEGRKEAKVTPMADVQTEIGKVLLADQKAGELTTKMGEVLKAKVAEKGNLADALSAVQEEARAALTPTEEAPANEEGSEDAKPAPKKTTEWDAVSVRETDMFNLEGQDLSALFGGQLPPGVTIPAGDWDRIPGIGKSSAVALDAFKLTKEKPTNGKLYDVEGSKVIISFKAAQKPDEAKANERKAEYYTEIVGKRTQQIGGNWQSMFLVPADEYGPWIDKLYNDAVKANRITFNERVKMAKILRDATPITGTAAKKDDAADKKDEKKEAK